MRKLLIGLGITLLVLLVSDFGLRILAQSWVGGQLRQSLELSEKPSVSLGGFPFIFAAVTGDFPSVSFEARRFEAEGLSFEVVEVDLHGVTFPPSRLISRSSATIRADRGEGTAVMTGPQVSEALSDQGVPVQVRFTDGVIHLSARPLPGEVEARAEIENGVLVIRPADRSVSGSFSLPLPPIIPGLTYVGLAIEGSEARLEVEIDDPVFEVGG